jgi:glyoxylate reductase
MMVDIDSSRQRTSLSGKKPKVFCSRKMPEIVFEMIKDLVDLEVWEQEDAPPRDVLIQKVKDCDGFISLLTDKIDAEFLDACPKLKLITQLAVGYNNIDLDAATQRGIYVTNTPDVLTDTVVETTFALLFAVSRRIVEADKYVREGNWKVAWHPLMMLGSDLCGGVLGIIGLGRIGKKVATVAQAFGARVIYYDMYRSQDFEKEFNVQYVELDQLYRESDFISVHVNLTPETKHIINATSLALMKPNCIIVNTARGPVINQTDLAEALKNRRIAGAGLDVFETEPIEMDDPLLQLDNCVVLPHLGSASYNTRRRMAQIVGQNQVAFWKGQKKLVSLVNTNVERVNPL